MAWSLFQKLFKRFVNPHIKDIKRDLWDAILWRFGYYAEKKPREAPPDDFVYPGSTASYDPSQPWALWIGHSTFLIRVNGLVFMTDPIFGSYCSPIHCNVFKRRHEPAIAMQDLPSVDCIMISHNHYDHLDEQSVLELHRRNPNIVWVVPRGLKKWFERRHIHSVYELDWGQSYQLRSDCKITAVPAQHFSGRHLWDKNRTLWCGYVMESRDKTFYFVGDTGYNFIDFKQIGARWPSIDLSMIPIGVYVPEKFMKPVHISPYEAVNIHCDTHSRLSLGMHWKTFRLSEEPMDRPPYDLYLAMKQKGLSVDTFLPIEPGRFINW